MKYKSGKNTLGFSSTRKMGVEIEACNVVTKTKYYGKSTKEIEYLKENAQTQEELEKIIFESKSGLYQGESAKLIEERKWRMVPASEESLVAHGGAELASKPFTDTEESWENLICICDNIKKYPGTSSNANGKVVAGNKCGLHVHFDATDITKTPQRLETFLRLYSESEELLYKMCNPKGEALRNQAMKPKKYKTFRLGVISSLWKHGMARPSSKMLMDKMEKGTLKVNTKPKGLIGSLLCKYKLHDIARYRGLNLTNIGYSLKNTVEFRMANGCLDPEEIKKTIFLYASLYETAIKIADGKDETILKKWDEFKDRNVSEKEKAQRFLGLIIDDKEDQNIYLERWESVKDYDIYKNPKFLKTFNREDYKTFAQKTSIINLENAKKVFDRITTKEKIGGLEFGE